MKSSVVIEHEGVVREIAGTTIKVEIISSSACSTCHAKEACILADQTHKIIDVQVPPGNYRVGDSVIVMLEESLGIKAFCLAYLLPFFILIATLFVASGLFEKEWMSGVITIIVVALYYLVLNLFKNRLKKEFSFRLKRPAIQ